MYDIYVQHTPGIYIINYGHDTTCRLLATILIHSIHKIKGRKLKVLWFRHSSTWQNYFNICFKVMDNATYDEVDLTPISTDETYSRLRATETKIKPSYDELQKTENLDHHVLKGVKQTNVSESPNTTKFSAVMIIMMVILLLITLTSIALSVTTFSHLASEQSNNAALVSQFDIIQMNLSQKVLELVIAQNNISQNLNQLNTKLETSIPLLLQYLKLSAQIHCGPGLWHQLVYLNMSDPSQQCPSAWREYNISGVRACGRPDSGTGSCPSVQYISYQQYSRVCGRIIGYQYATPDAFQPHPPNNIRINLDGINITRGVNRSHIWSYVAGVNQNTSSQSASKCPCSTDNEQVAGPPPSIGNRYYCESGNPGKDHEHNIFYSDDPLWDGQKCEGTCCTGTNSPPWFNVLLPPTTDAIEVSICCDQSTNDEDVPVKLIEILLQ